MFTTKGPVEPKDFIGRQELVKTKEYLNKRSYIALSGARQTGRTSLLWKLEHDLRESYRFVYVNCEGLHDQSADKCYDYIFTRVEEELGIPVSHRTEGINTGVAFSKFLGEAWDKESSGRPIVVMLDEIGAITRENLSNLASSIRFIFHQDRERFRFVISGATEILDLTLPNVSPLRNVVSNLYMGDLTSGETEQLLRKGLGPGIDLSPQAIERIYKETHGHPYLVQRLGEILEQILVEEGSKELAITYVREATQRLLEDDSNLGHIGNLLRREDKEVKETLRQIYDGSYEGRFTYLDPILARLGLAIGAIRGEKVEEEGEERVKCVIRNEIYRRFLKEQFKEEMEAQEPEEEQVAEPIEQPAITAVESGRFLSRRDLAVMITAVLGFATVIMAFIATVTRSAPVFVAAMIFAGLTFVAILFNLFIMQ